MRGLEWAATSRVLFGSARMSLQKQGVRGLRTAAEVKQCCSAGRAQCTACWGSSHHGGQAATHCGPPGLPAQGLSNKHAVLGLVCSEMNSRPAALHQQRRAQMQTPGGDLSGCCCMVSCRHSTLAVLRQSGDTEAPSCSPTPRSQDYLDLDGSISCCSTMRRLEQLYARSEQPDGNLPTWERGSAPCFCPPHVKTGAAPSVPGGKQCTCPRNQTSGTAARCRQRVRFMLPLRASRQCRPGQCLDGLET